jgi:hypothetical protein
MKTFNYKIFSYFLLGIITILLFIIFYMLLPDYYPCELAVERYEEAYKILLKEHPDIAKELKDILDEMTE